MIGSVDVGHGGVRSGGWRVKCLEMELRIKNGALLVIKAVTVKVAIAVGRRIGSLKKKRPLPQHGQSFNIVLWILKSPISTYHTWVWDQPVQCLHPSYQSRCGFFFSSVVGGRTFIQLEMMVVLYLVVVSMWLCVQASCVYLHDHLNQKSGCIFSYYSVLRGLYVFWIQILYQICFLNSFS